MAGFEMATDKSLRAAQVALAHEATILSRRAHHRTPGTGRPLLIVHNHPTQTAEVVRIVAAADPDSVRVL